MQWGASSFYVGPLTALGAVAVLSLLLRWTFSRGSSLVESRPRSGGEVDYGLLVAVSRPSTYIEGEVQRRTLEDAGVRATLASTTEGARIMVVPQDEARARRILGRAADG